MTVDGFTLCFVGVVEMGPYEVEKYVSNIAGYGRAACKFGRWVLTWGGRGAALSPTARAGVATGLT